jgi:RNA polymerase sigma-70 factor (ECF subfamily)
MLEDDPADGNCAAGAAARDRVLEIYREHSPSLLNHLARTTGSLDLARDVAQETFVRLLRMPPAMVARIERPDSYLRRIATNLLRDRARTRALAERSRPALEVSGEALVDQVRVLESRDTLRRLELAIGRLKPKTREIFLAHRIRGLSYSEIAASTGLSIKGVEKQMSKAIAKIDRLLDRP